MIIIKFSCYLTHLFYKVKCCIQIINVVIIKRRSFEWTLENQISDSRILKNIVLLVMTNFITICTLFNVEH